MSLTLPVPTHELFDTDPAVAWPDERTSTSEHLRRVVADVVARPDFWQPYVRFTDEERYWVKLPVTADADVWLLTWKTFQKTDLHDHGASEAAFAVVRGAVHEIRPVAGRLIPRKIIPGLVHTIPVGQIHDVRNELAEPAVSIHAYSPRLEVMSYYSWRNGAPQFERTVIGDEPETSPRR